MTDPVVSPSNLDSVAAPSNYGFAAASCWNLLVFLQKHVLVARSDLVE